MHPYDVGVRKIISAFYVARRLCKAKSRPRTTEDVKLQRHRLLTSEIKYKCLLNMFKCIIYIYVAYYYACCRARCPRGLGRGSAAACLLGLGGLKSCQGHRSLSLVIVVCCQVEVSETNRSLVQRSPTEFDVFVCDQGNSAMMMPRPTGAVKPWGEENITHVFKYIVTFIFGTFVATIQIF
jgi:hypothetical protein